MNIKDVISQLRDNSYYASLVTEQTQLAIIDFVFCSEPQKSFVVASNIPAIYVNIFFNDQVAKLEDDTQIIGRYLLALFLSIKEKDWLEDNHWVEDIKIDLLLTYIPDFYQLIKSKSELMQIIFDAGTIFSLPSGIKYLRKVGFSDDDITQYFKSDIHSHNGHHNYEHNLYLHLIVLPKIQQAFQAGDGDAFDRLILEYIELNLRDYSTVICMPDDNIQGARYREQLPENHVQCFLNLIRGQGDWAQDITLIYSGLVKKELYCDHVHLLTLLHADEDFKLLLTLIFQASSATQLASSKYVSNFTEIIRLIDPDLWVRESFPKDCFVSNHHGNCCFATSETVLNYLDATELQYPTMHLPLISFVLNYLSANYSYCLDSKQCPDHQMFEHNNHRTLLAALVERYGAVYIWDCCLLNRNYAYMLSLNLLVQLEPNNLVIKQRKQQADEMRLERDLPDLCDNENDSAALMNFVIKGQSPEQVAQLVVSADELYQVCWLNDLYIERLARVFFNGKNDSDAGEFIEKANQYISPRPLRLLSDVVIKHPTLQAAYFKALVSYTQSFIEYDGVVGNNGQYYQSSMGGEFRYYELIPQIELAYLQQHGMPCVTHILTCSNEDKLTLLACLVGTIYDRQQALLLITLLTEKNKGLLALCYANIKALCAELRLAVIGVIIKQLSTLKGQHEINAVIAICLHPLEGDLALTLIEQVQQSKSRSLLVEHAKLDFALLYQTNADANNNTFDLDRYLIQCYLKPKKPLLNDDIIAQLKTAQGKCGQHAGEQLLQIYQNHDQFTVNSEASAIISVLDDSSFQTFNANILATYLDKITAKNRWLLALPAIHGNAQCINMLSNAVEQWANGAKHQLAAHVIKQMGASGITEAYVAIERIGRNSKKQSIKDAVITAFAIGAKKKGITRDQLGDSLVEDIGFVGNEIPLRYCEQDYALLLTKDLKFAIKKPDGKIAKSLPKPKADDNSEAAAQVAKDFILLKKLLKGVIELQSHRLEDAFVIWRHWSSEQWTQLFLDNPIMNKLASRLVWGLYQDNCLVKAFTVNPQPIDLNDQTLNIEAHYQIGLVHGSELESAQLCQWIEYFEDWGIELLFNQLNTDEITVEHKEEKLDYQVSAPRKSPSTVINRLRKKGWTVGSVRDGGCFDEIYKEIESLNVGIEITFDDSIYHGDYGYECDEGDITINKIQFYRTGIIERGSYCYDELEETDSRIDKSTLPSRLTQELVREAVVAFS